MSGRPDSVLLTDLQEVGRRHEVALAQGLRTVAFRTREGSRHLLDPWVEQERSSVRTNGLGPGRRANSGSLAKQLDQPRCYREFLVVHVVGALAILPIQTH